MKGNRWVVHSLGGVVGIGVVAFVTLVLSIKIGFRPIYVGTDYSRYHRRYEVMREQGGVLGHWEPGFELMAVLAGQLGASAEVFFSFLGFFVISMVLLSSWLLLRLVFPSNGTKRVIAFGLVAAILLIWPFLWNGLTNVIRHGTAIAILFPAVYALHVGRYWTFGALVLGAALFHWSAPVFGASAFVGKIVGWRWMLGLAVGVGVLYGVGATGSFVLVVERLTGVGVYSRILEYGADSSYSSGYRLDFLLFSSFPVLVWGLLWVLSRRVANEVGLLVGVYCALLFPFFMFGFGAYSDRWALAAWLFMPVVMGGMLVSILKADRALASFLVVGLLCAWGYAVWSLPIGWIDVFG